MPTMHAIFKAMMLQLTEPFDRALSRLPQEVKGELKAADFEGVMLGGNFVAGVALGKCVEFGYDFAADIAKQLQAQQA